jgi:hypothetical protein
MIMQALNAATCAAAAAAIAVVFAVSLNAATMQAAPDPLTTSQIELAIVSAMTGGL